jgi:hypothetical protein
VKLASAAILALCVLGTARVGQAWAWADPETFPPITQRTEITTLGLNSSMDSQKIVKDGAGNALAAWNLVGASVSGTHYTLGSGWTLPETLVGGFVFEWDLDMNDGGSTIVAGIRRVQPTPGVFRNDLVVEVGDPSTQFLKEGVADGVPSPLNDLAVKVAISANGDAIAVWEDALDLRYVLFRGGAFETEASLGNDNPVGLLWFDVAADDFGNFTVVWPDAGENAIVARRLVAGTLNAVEVIGDPATSAREPQVAMYGNGHAIAAWSASLPDAHRGIAVNRFDGSSWGAQQSIDAGAAAGSAFQPHVAVQTDGTTMVDWMQGFSGGTSLIYANRRSAGTWDGAVQIGCDQFGESASIDMDGLGNAAATAFIGDGFSRLVRAYGEGVGWIDTFPAHGAPGCSFQGQWIFGAREFGASSALQLFEKKFVITQHEIVGIEVLVTGSVGGQDFKTVYGTNATKDVYINGFDEQTTTSIVDLDVTLPFNTIPLDPPIGGQTTCGFVDPFLFQEMRFSNNGVDWSAWESAPTTAPFRTTRTNWDLTDPAFGGISVGGLKRVYIQYRNQNCESLVTTDEIYLPEPGGLLGLCAGGLALFGLRRLRCGSR